MRKQLQPAGPPLPELLTVDQVRQWLGFKDPESVVRLITRKQLEAHKVGREWRVTREALDDFLLSTSTVPARRRPRSTPTIPAIMRGVPRTAKRYA